MGRSQLGTPCGCPAGGGPAPSMQDSLCGQAVRPDTASDLSAPELILLGDLEVLVVFDSEPSFLC